MHIVLENIIEEKTTQRLLELYEQFNHVGAINKKVFEYKMQWNSVKDQALRQYLIEVIGPIAQKKWKMQSYEFTNIKIREYPTGTFYERHVDFYRTNPQNIYLSFSVVLNNDFVGGEFILEDKAFSGRKAFDLRKGEAILFDGTDYHEVLKITQGYRMSLIGHMIGKI